MIVLTILFGYAIWMNGNTFVAIQGRWARQLELPGAEILPFLPWIALGAYVLSVIAIHRIKIPWKRWLSFVAATLLGNLVICYPMQLLERETIRIPVVDSLNLESTRAFEAGFPVKWVGFSSSRDGACIRVRKDDYSPELAAFVVGLAARQSKSDRDAGP